MRYTLVVLIARLYCSIPILQLSTAEALRGNTQFSDYPRDGFPPHLQLPLCLMTRQ